MSQLLNREDEAQRGYEDYDDDEDVTFRRSHTDMKQSMLHLLSTEIVLNTGLHKNLCIIRSDFKRFGLSLSHSTIFAVMKFFGVSPKWLGVFRNALEGKYVWKGSFPIWKVSEWALYLGIGHADSEIHVSTHQNFRS